MNGYGARPADGSKGKPGTAGSSTAVKVGVPIAVGDDPRIKTVAYLPAACNNDAACAEWPGAQLEAQPGDPAVPGAIVTIQDLARFLPAAAELTTEPDGWAVVGVPANFFVDVAPVTVDGELLGQAAQVRFTPRRYHWDYGDGAGRTTDTPGASWRTLGQEDLTATPTGHVYRARADVEATVAVAYSAEYRIDGGDWIAVVGAVTDTSPPAGVLVVTERTVLTAGDAGD